MIRLTCSVHPAFLHRRFSFRLVAKKNYPQLPGFTIERFVQPVGADVPVEDVHFEAGIFFL